MSNHKKKRARDCEESDPLSIALITLSYAPDFERCKLLKDTVERFVSPRPAHYVLVDRRDYKLFSTLADSHTRIIPVERILPWWIFRVPRITGRWASCKTLWIRNWLVQQIVKIGVARYINEDVLLFADSDVAFIRPFDPRSVVVDGRVRLWREVGKADDEKHRPWHRTAGEVLGLDPRDYYGADYIGNLITWKRTNVLQLHERIARVDGKSWQKVLTRYWDLSEYILYGVYVDQVLGEKSGHYYDKQSLCLNYWKPKNLSDADLRAFLQGVSDDHVAVMISSRAGIDPGRYASLLGELS